MTLHRTLVTGLSLETTIDMTRHEEIDGHETATPPAYYKPTVSDR